MGHKCECDPVHYKDNARVQEIYISYELGTSIRRMTAEAAATAVAIDAVDAACRLLSCCVVDNLLHHLRRSQGRSD
jgi:hypothetical protein